MPGRKPSDEKVNDRIAKEIFRCTEKTAIATFALMKTAKKRQQPQAAHDDVQLH
jgi:fructose-1,6-bisphosphatase/sedoheptulose 1,7-bisphosphatase-like protein